MLLLLLLIGGGSYAWGEEVTSTFIASKSSYTAGMTLACSEKNAMSWVTSAKPAGIDPNGRGIQWSKTATTLTSTYDESSVVSKVVVTVASNSSLNDQYLASVSVGGVSYGSQKITKDLTGLEFTGNSSGKISVTTSQGTKSTYIKSIVVTVISGGDTPGTPVNLTAPTNLVATNVTATTATLSWDKVENASSYTLKIGEKEIENVVAPYTAEGLTASTEYTWSVKAVGDGSRYISSEYATGEAFTTLKEGVGVIVIDANAIVDFTSKYQEYDWVTGSFSGKCFAYLYGGNMQFNSTPYVYNTTAIPGRIKSVKITKGGGKDRSWSVYMSDKVLTSSENGEQVGTAQTISTSHTWTVPNGKNYQYFYIEKGSNSTQISSIEVEYEPASTLTSLAISGTPNQTTYQDGEAFDPAGLVVTGTYDDGSTQEITDDVTWKISPEKLTTGITSVEVKASVGNVTSEVFTVNGLTVKEKVTLTRIEVEGTAAEFWKGDKFNHDGITVTATWSKGDGTNVTEACEYTGYDMNTAGKQTVTVTYQGKTATYEIEVKTIANTQETAYTVAEAIAYIDAGKDLSSPVYVKGIVSKIVEPFKSQYGNVSFNVSADGSADGAQFQFFRTQKDAENKFTENPNIEVGATVIGCGTLDKYNDKYNDIYEFKAGNYLVSYVAPYTAQTLTFVAKSNGVYWATFSSDKVVFMPSNDVDVYTVVVEGNKLVTMSGKDDVFGSEETLSVGGESVKGYYIPANTGVLLYSLEETLTYYTFENKTVDAVNADFNMLKPASEKMTDGFKYYKLAYDNFTEKTGLGFYWGAAEGGAFTVKPGLAYLAVPQAQAANVKGFSFDGTQTGINGVEATTAKGAIYNLNGQRVEKAQRGIYIQNGKKFIVK